MSTSVFIRNQQRTYAINVRYLRWMTRELLQELLWIENFDLGIYLVRAPKMAQINQTYLQHEGSTDVITFDYSEAPAVKSRIGNSKSEVNLHGELFICIDEAIAQARQFRTTWQSELVRYVIHGVLHLCGYDDLNPAARRVMKREETRLLHKLKLNFPPAKLAGPGRASLKSPPTKR
ncbi:MAG: rRNA maturation RNase YbeY [Akkermansiaceae bacterium]|nr:rRNA maturation RNase YbeY [Verrucomicrobiales bacterium]